MPDSTKPRIEQLGLRLRLARRAEDARDRESRGEAQAFELDDLLAQRHDHGQADDRAGDAGEDAGPRVELGAEAEQVDRRDREDDARARDVDRARARLDLIDLEDRALAATERTQDREAEDRRDRRAGQREAELEPRVDEGHAHRAADDERRDQGGPRPLTVAGGGRTFGAAHAFASFCEELVVQDLHGPLDVGGADDEGDVHLQRAERDHAHFDTRLAEGLEDAGRHAHAIADAVADDADLREAVLDLDLGQARGARRRRPRGRSMSVERERDRHLRGRDHVHGDAVPRDDSRRAARGSPPARASARSRRRRA